MRYLIPVVCMFTVASLSHAADVEVVQIQEDWELQIAEPDEKIDAPQVTTTMIPFGEGSETLFQIDLNHATEPEFSNGGLQVRYVYFDDTMRQVRLLSDERLRYSQETITWTQAIVKSENGYLFGIKNGKSQSWGDFGDGSVIFVQSAPENSAGLGAYDSQLSIDNSRVSFAGNRVISLKLKAVRYYSNKGDVKEVQIDTDVNAH